MSIESLKKRVKKRYPECICMMDSAGEYYIAHRDVSLHEVFMLPSSETELEAWSIISQFVQVEQSINRTHPLKAMISEHKKLQNRERISNRIHG